jgi:uncharacterized protein
MGAFVLSSAVQRCAEQLMARRKVLLGFFMLLTLALGYSATHVRLDPGFNKQIPVRHAYMLNFLDFSRSFHRCQPLAGQRAVERRGGYLQPRVPRNPEHVTDDVFYISGVSRPSVTSLFTPNVRYIEITEDGFVGDLVVPPAIRRFGRRAAASAQQCRALRADRPPAGQ